MVNDTFAVLSHPIRREILERLAAGPASVGEATVGIEVSKPAITKHVRVLEESGLVTRTIEGRMHVLALCEEPLDEAAEWIERQRRRWERAFDALEEHLREEGA